ncbi:DUF1820 family protein [Pokkaliibacter sp. MBI-7]|uniref:DUF1820 family protein n=1 Tax=Pokkaliibacter sp. MBI-7 TaxID=3040600 RepID=UPI002447BD4A|nr:DUF1820 family protein [Pokkaliibacter sp. MBI-7]MDH2434507.1 DUF1820 family protein [Pokkaliibacter sp. MBI-7]
MTKDRIYKVIFQNQDKIYEVFARSVGQSDLWGFIEIESFIFGERSQMLVDPAEEKLKAEFGEVKRSYIPMHSIIRIDEVQKEGVAKMRDSKGSVTAFPGMPFPSKSD